MPVLALVKIHLNCKYPLVKIKLLPFFFLFHMIELNYKLSLSFSFDMVLSLDKTKQHFEAVEEQKVKIKNTERECLNKAFIGFHC